MHNGKIQNFTDLNAWREGHALVLGVYLITKTFPKEELFGLTSQMRRCAVSITSNIAEGFGRHSHKEKIQFYFIASGSVLELQNQLIIARDTDLINEKEYVNLFNRTIDVHKIIGGLIRSIREYNK